VKTRASWKEWVSKDAALVSGLYKPKLVDLDTILAVILNEHAGPW